MRSIARVEGSAGYLRTQVQAGAYLGAIARRTDRSFRQTVSDALRLGPARPRASAASRQFTVAARDLGVFAQVSTLTPLATRPRAIMRSLFDFA